VAQASHRAAPAGLGAGWAALRDGRWETARACFEQALGDGETPEALEGLSWAAWWLDDRAAVFDARERAYGAYKAAGDPAGAARMATWLASDELDFHGAVAVASGWLARGHRLLDPLGPGPDHGWIAFLDGYLAHAGGDTAQAAGLGRRAAQLGRRFGVPDLEMLGLALEGATLVACAEVPDGMRRLDEATVLALEGDTTIPISRAWACCFLVTACTEVRDYERACTWCDRIAEFADRYGSRYMLAFCRAEYGAIHLWRGRWGDAAALLEESVADYARSRPGWVGQPLATLAELRRRQGRSADAAVLLDRAGPSGTAQLCQARLALDAGDAQRAVELAERVLRRLPPERRLARASALELATRAQAARGALDEAARTLAELRAVARLVGTAPLRAAADLAEGVLAAEAGDHERARTLLEDAIDGFERSGGPYDAALARIELATTLAALGRPGDAAREAEVAAARLDALGAPVAAARARVIARAAGTAGLSRREHEVLGLLAEGLTNRQIAARLVLSEHTVHRHVANILCKLGVPSRAAAVARAISRDGPSGRSRGSP
jgi:LuxR family transcriptional regulator, maltose regulon positive regulatory protein